MMDRTDVIRALFSCLVGLGALSLGGCEPAPPVDKIVVQITIPEGHEAMVANWGSLRVSSTGYGAGACVPYIPGSPAGVNVEVPPAPLGAATRVVAEAFAAVDANGQPAGACQILVSRGATPFLTVTASTPKIPMQVLMGPVGEFIRTSSAQQAGAAGSAGVVAVPTQPGMLRHGSSMTALPDGRIVIIGGAELKPGLTDVSGAAEGPIWNQLTLSGAIGQVHETVEIYNPATGIFEVLAAEPTSPQTMANPRMFHNAVWLESIGHIAVVGGWQQIGQTIEASNLIELFDPFQKVFLDASTVESLQIPRAMATTTVLDYNGGVQYLLVAGGTNSSVNPAQAEGTLEIVDMSPNSLRVVSGPLDVIQEAACSVCLYGDRFNHRAVMVDDCGPEQHRCVYFVGGETASKTVQKLVDVFDVKTGQLIQAPLGADAPAELAQARVDHEVVYIPAPTANQENFMYVVGGFSDTSRKSPVSLIEVISAKNGAQLAGTGFTLKTGRGQHRATRMDGGKVLVSGGLIADGAGGLAMATTSEIIGPTYPYDPLTNSWNTSIQNVLSTQTTSLLTQRFGHNAVFMDNDQLLVLGGAQKIGTSVQQVGPTTATNTPSELYVYDPSPLYEPGQ